MGKIYKGVQSTTQAAVKDVTAMNGIKKTLDTGNEIGGVIRDAKAIGGKAVLLALSKAWIGLGLVNPAKTDGKEIPGVNAAWYARLNYKGQVSTTPEISRFDTANMWSIRFGNYFMPLSQTYTVRATKKLNISSLVDGIDIIQQTRKEAKTIDCTLKISINESQKNLQLMTRDEEGKNAISKLQEFLNDLYENDIVFLVDNETINDTLGVSYVIMSSYRFMPRAGSKTYIFEFSLTEVKFGDNVLTFDERQIQAPAVNDTNGLLA